MPQLDAFVDATVAETGPVILMGNSLGACVSVRAAARGSGNISGTIAVDEPILASHLVDAPVPSAHRSLSGAGTSNAGPETTCTTVRFAASSLGCCTPIPARQTPGCSPASSGRSPTRRTFAICSGMPARSHSRPPRVTTRSASRVPCWSSMAEKTASSRCTPASACTIRCRRAPLSSCRIRATALNSTTRRELARHVLQFIDRGGK